MSYYSRDTSGGYFELTKQIAQFKQIIFKILKTLKLDYPCSSCSSSCSSSSSSSELEITDDVSFIENFEERIKSIEELKIEEKLNGILDNLNNQLSSIENLSNNSQIYLLKVPYEVQIQTYIPNITNYLCTYTDIRKGAIPNLTSLDTIFHFNNYRRESPCSITSFANNKIDKLFYLNGGDNKVQIGSDLSLGIGSIFVGGAEL
jgi:hypothetical protein